MSGRNRKNEEINTKYYENSEKWKEKIMKRNI